MNVGIFGGTFNPPHKELPAGSPDGCVRLEMARMAFKGVKNALVSDVELRRAGKSYTIDTVEQVLREYKGAQIYLILGCDMYTDLEAWKDAGRLLTLVLPAVLSRDDDDAEKIKLHAERIKNQFGVNTKTVANIITPISSSQLRQLLKNRGGAGYIDDTIYAYIIKHRLYGAKPDWDWLRSRAYSMLDPARIPHVRGCEESALSLAERWGADLDDAREAAILHDITKRLSLEDNLRILDTHGIMTDRLEYSEEKLLHSKTGAVLAKAEFGVSDAVAEAIRWHTTGRAYMSKLEKIIYLADYIEPTRKFDGVGALRELACESLDKAVIMGLELSVEDMKARGITPNRTTFDALDDLKA